MIVEYSKTRKAEIPMNRPPYFIIVIINEKSQFSSHFQGTTNSPLIQVSSLRRHIRKGSDESEDSHTDWLQRNSVEPGNSGNSNSSMRQRHPELLGNPNRASRTSSPALTCPRAPCDYEMLHLLQNIKRMVKNVEHKVCEDKRRQIICREWELLARVCERFLMYAFIFGTIMFATLMLYTPGPSHPLIFG